MHHSEEESYDQQEDSPTQSGPHGDGRHRCWTRPWASGWQDAPWKEGWAYQRSANPHISSGRSRGHDQNRELDLETRVEAFTTAELLSEGRSLDWIARRLNVSLETLWGDLERWKKVLPSWFRNVPDSPLKKAEAEMTEKPIAKTDPRPDLSQKTKTIAIKLPLPVWEQLKDLAGHDYRTVSAQAMKIICDHLKEHHRERGLHRRTLTEADGHETDDSGGDDPDNEPAGDERSGEALGLSPW